MEPIALAIVVTAIGTVIAGVVLGAGSIAWRRLRRRRAKPPLRAALRAEPMYAPGFGVFGAAGEQVRAQVGRGETLTETIAKHGVSYLCGTPLVLHLQNTSSTTNRQNIRVKEVTVAATKYLDLKGAVAEEPLLVAATTIQSAGRGSEGSYTVLLCTTEQADVPLIRSAAAETGGSIRGLTVGADASAEICIAIHAANPGRYAIDVTLTVEWRDREEIVPVVTGLRVIEVTDWEWAEALVDSFYWSNPEFVGREALQSRYSQWQEWKSNADLPCPDDRRVVVTGFISDEPW